MSVHLAHRFNFHTVCIMILRYPLLMFMLTYSPVYVTEASGLWFWGDMSWVTKLYLSCTMALEVFIFNMAQDLLV